MTRSNRHAITAMAFVAVLPSIGQPQQPGAAQRDTAADLAKKLSNPISDLVSVPLQFNWEQNVGPFKLTRFILNVQPVMPFTLSEEWTLIARVIAPFISQPPLSENGEAAFGMGDITTSFFLSPRSTGFIWGVGPVIVLPSTSEPTLGSGKWSVGPTLVLLKQSGGWTVGALWNQVWSFSGDERRDDVDQMFLQPFLAYQATRTLTLTVQSETTANWNADDDRWTIPINVVASKLSSFGEFPASYAVGIGSFVAHPDLGPTWKLRGAVTILLPRSRR
jgi:hypothetical protein